MDISDDRYILYAVENNPSQKALDKNSIKEKFKTLGAIISNIVYPTHDSNLFIVYHDNDQYDEFDEKSARFFQIDDIKLSKITPELSPVSLSKTFFVLVLSLSLAV